jgi:hypothetical protein
MGGVIFASPFFTSVGGVGHDGLGKSLVSVRLWLGHRLCVGRDCGADMNLRHLFITMLAVSSMLLAQQRAYALDVNTAFQRMMIGVVGARTTSAGATLASQTLSAIGSRAAAAAATGAAVTVAGVTAPAWVSVAAVALAGYTIGLGLQAGINWLINSDGTLTRPGSANPGNVAALTAGGAGYCVFNACYPTVAEACAYASTATGSLGNVTYITTWVGGGTSGCQQHTEYSNGTSDDSDAAPVFHSEVCYGVNAVRNAAGCSGTTLPDLPAVTYPTLTAAVASLPASELAKPLSTKTVADLSNKLWSDAASQPGYVGVAYDYANPITEAETQTWRDANADSWPTVGDFVAPQTGSSSSGGTGTTTNPFALTDTTTTTPGTTTPDTSTTPTTGIQNVNVVNRVAVDLGPDPGVGFPTLEEVPTMPQILQPIFDLMPSVKSFKTPQHSSVCPTASFDLFGRTFVMDQHCALFERIRPELLTSMLAAFSIMALLIVLSA